MNPNSNSNSNSNQYIQPYLRTNALLNNYNDTKENSINQIIDGAFDANSKNFIIIIGNVIADILNKYNIEKSVVIIHYIIQKINIPVKVEEKYIILDIIRRLTLRSDDISNNLINNIRLKYNSEDDIQQYLNNSNSTKSNRSINKTINKTINKNDCFQSIKYIDLIVKIIGFFNYKGDKVVKAVLSLNAQNKFCITIYESFLKFFKKIKDCSINLDMNQNNIKDKIYPSAGFYYVKNDGGGYPLFNDSDLKQNWTPPPN